MVNTNKNNTSAVFIYIYISYNKWMLQYPYLLLILSKMFWLKKQSKKYFKNLLHPNIVVAILYAQQADVILLKQHFIYILKDSSSHKVLAKVLVKSVVSYESQMMKDLLSSSPSWQNFIPWDCVTGAWGWVGGARHWLILWSLCWKPTSTPRSCH